jgi:hypothetical protein
MWMPRLMGWCISVHTIMAHQRSKQLLVLLLPAGHSLDQKRLQQPLYRHPWEDVLYTK